MTVDLGVSYEEAREEARFPTLEAGDYEFQVVGVEETQTNERRPMFAWTFEVINHPDPEVNGTKLFYNTPLTYRDHNGELVKKGIGLLFALAQGVGRPWDGMEFDENSLVGLQGKLQNSPRGYCTTCRKARKPGAECPECGQMVDPRNNVKKIYER